MEPTSQNGNNTIGVHTHEIFSLPTPLSFFSQKLSSSSLISLPHGKKKITATTSEIKSENQNPLKHTNIKPLEEEREMATTSQIQTHHSHTTNPNPTPTPTTTSQIKLPQLHHKSKPNTHNHNHISKIQTPRPHLKSELHAYRSNQKLEITIKIPYQPK